MFPILFRIPLPHFPLKLWWALAAFAGIALVYTVLSLRRRERNTAVFLVLVAGALGVAAWKFKETSYQAQNLPIYSYGVMLGVSLVVGWYLTLKLADKEGLPKETMANCYVITALAAIAGSRILYILTNLQEFEDPVTQQFVFSNIFALRKGGLVAYGGFLGGFLGSWGYLYTKKIRLLAWADAAVPSLATGLMITRIGCYLFGCDFGTRLSDTAPGFLKKLGTFPHWPAGTLDGGDGSPAYVRHLEYYDRGSPMWKTLTETNHSLPVHPTQLYESFVGLGLFALLMWQRKHLKFRGQMFFLFVFAYGYLRVLLEIIRDDVERGEFGPKINGHVYVPVCLALFAVAFVFGISLAIKNLRARTVARVVSFVPAVVAYFLMKPPQFQEDPMQLSTSQWIGLLTALLASFFYGIYWQEARKRPAMAMALGEGALEQEPEDDASDATQTDTPAAKKKGKKKKVVAEEPETKEPVAAKEPASAADDGDDEEDDDEPAPAPAAAPADKPKEKEKEKEKDVPVTTKPSPEPTT
jgi:phosphatidylglycerol:prolipoprotein diacylglycerol transferase